MRRASDDTLQQRTILKASKPPQKGMARAAESVIKQRKIVKAKRSPFRSPSGNGENPRNSPTPETPNSSQQNTSPTPTSSAPGSTPTPLSRSASGSPSTPTEDVFLEMRAKLFSKDASSGWVKVAAGTLRCCRMAGDRVIKLQGENGPILLEIEVAKLKGLAKVIKVTKKGKAAYARFTAAIGVNKGEESFLIQVKPELLDELYAAMA